MGATHAGGRARPCAKSWFTRRHEDGALAARSPLAREPKKKNWQPAAQQDIFVSSCENLGQAPAPAGEYRITPEKIATGDGRCGLPESHTGVAGATIVANAGREAVQEPVRSALWHRGATGRARALAVDPGAYPRLNSRAPELPLPMSVGTQHSLRASPGRQRGGDSAALEQNPISTHRSRQR